MRLGYFPGCSLSGTAKEFDLSTLAVAPLLGFSLEEIRDWNCCGATSAHATNHLLSIALPSRNLAIAESQGITRILAPCAACFNRLSSARNQVGSDAGLAARISEIIEYPPGKFPEVISVVQLLRDLIPTLREKISQPLQGMKVACYYGCLLLRPSEVCAFDDPEDPTSMEEVVRELGAEPVSWPMRLECCGGGFSLCRMASVVRLGREILASAQAAGADTVVVACPMCQSNLDFRQQAISASMDSPVRLPILYLTQLVGMALGLKDRDLGFSGHYVNPSSLLDRITRAPVVVKTSEVA